jgi:hypothetical protein
MRWCAARLICVRHRRRDGPAGQSEGRQNMAELVKAEDVRVGDVMMDPNGNLAISRVAYDNRSVLIWLRDESGAVDPFTATWEFGRADLVRIVTRSGQAAGQ